MEDESTQCFQKKLFHIIIGENHLYESSVKVAEQFLKFIVDKDYKNITVCFEHPESLNILSYYKERKKLAIELYESAVESNSDYDFLLKKVKLETKSVDLKKTLLLTLFGKDRIVGIYNICDYCSTKKIKFIGIDTEQFKDIEDLIEKRKKRSNFMYEQLKKFDQQGMSTIFIVGQSHLIDLYEKSKDETNYHFFLIEDKKDFLSLPIPESIKKIYMQTLAHCSSSSLDENIKKNMLGKATLIKKEDLDKSENTIYLKIMSKRQEKSISNSNAASVGKSLSSITDQSKTHESGRATGATVTKTKMPPENKDSPTSKCGTG